MKPPQPLKPDSSKAFLLAGGTKKCVIEAPNRKPSFNPYKRNTDKTRMAPVLMFVL